MSAPRSVVLFRLSRGVRAVTMEAAMRLSVRAQEAFTLEQLNVIVAEDDPAVAVFVAPTTLSGSQRQALRKAAARSFARLLLLAEETTLEEAVERLTLALEATRALREHNQK